VAAEIGGPEEEGDERIRISVVENDYRDGCERARRRRGDAFEPSQVGGEYAAQGRTRRVDRYP